MNALQKIEPSQQHLTGPATWEAAKYWADLASKFQHASVAAQVMAGFVLNELHKAHGIKPGARTDLNLPTELGGSEAPKSWPDLVKDQAGVSDETARKWMGMADGVKKKWKKLAPQDRLKELMAVSPSAWTDKDMKLVCDSLHKVTDGKSQLDFMRELGLAKKPPGNPNATGGTARKLTTAELSAQARAQALEDSGRLGAVLKSSNANFFLLTEVNDLELDAQISVLEFALHLRRLWAKTPKVKRDAKVIESLIQADDPMGQSATK
jgi:hypothetical protein